MKRLSNRVATAVLLVLSLQTTPAVAAALANEAKVMELLRASPAVPVIDARSAQARAQVAPLADARVYTEAMPLERGPVLVIADTDAAAIAVADKLEARHADVQAYAVAGGSAVLERLRQPPVEHSPTSTAIPYDFVIPSDTCQTGPALQTFEGQ